MTTQLVKISADELIQNILDGRRDFSNIELEGGENLSQNNKYRELLGYLDRLGHRDSDIAVRSKFTFENSSLIHLRAPYLGLPHANFKGADLRYAKLFGADLGLVGFEGADLRWVLLSRANLEGADLRGTNLRGTNLGGAYIGHAFSREIPGWDGYLRTADFSEADLEGAYLRGTDFDGASICRAKNLEKTIDLGLAVFSGTVVTEEQKEIIKAARDKAEKDLFRVFCGSSL